MRSFQLGLFFVAPILLAQAPRMVLPEPSPRASASQQVGLTRIDISYNRPAVGGRKVWGELVPFGQIWRAGANENTVVAFSTPVRVGGTTLPAGRYGLHMLPTTKAFTVIFSTQSNAWGSYGYDPREDAVRVQVTAGPCEPTERLLYTFDDPTDRAVILALRWGTLRVPVRVEVDTPQVVVQSLRDQLRGQQQFYPECWSTAANWCLRSGVNLEEATVWVDRSLAIRETYSGLNTKAELLEKRGDPKTAASLRARALAIANETELNLAGYALLGQNKVDEAIVLFQRNVQQHPDSWNVHDSLAEAFAVKGDKARALVYYRKALEMVKQEDQRARIRAELAKLE